MYKYLTAIDSSVARILEKALNGGEINAEEAVRLFQTNNRELMVMMIAADHLRQSAVGDTVSFVRNRNINFTNICTGTCLFCAFHTPPDDIRNGYLLTLEEIAEKAREAARSGATEVCIQGGLHPRIEPDYYIAMCETVKKEAPYVHIHAFSPMEILYASRKAGLSIEHFLTQLKAAGLDSVPGTAAEILDDGVRKIICPKKLGVNEWQEVITTAHHLNIPTTATMMYGHVEKPEHRAMHLDIVRNIQKNGGLFTEFVPLRFVYKNTELFRRFGCGPHVPAFEDIKVHAVARIMLNGYIDNIQVSWVKLGKRAAQVCLFAGANDLGGTLMEEHISSSAGSQSPTSLTAEELKELIHSCERIPVERTTLYKTAETRYGN
jgi:7,8-didemethyl-8-hydroxy-5-deazariboflavin synthase CofH subunit